jgi:iron(III) transport system ATP-binding protein
VSAISIQGLSAGYCGEAVINDISFELAEKQLLAILGPSGSGKSTLLKTIAGFLAPMSGSITLEGVLVSSTTSLVPPEKRNIGLVPQEGSLFPHLDVSANIRFGIKRDPNARARVDELLEIIGMEAFAHTRPQELSGGQQQRVALARALAPKPKLILLDEPFTALDTSLRAQMREDIRSILTLTSTTAIMVTHDQEEALATADQLALMQGGQLIAYGVPLSLYNNPESVAVAQLLGEINVIPAVVEAGNSVRTDFGVNLTKNTGELNPGVSGTLIVRPEAIAIDENQTPNATIIDSLFHGHDSLISVRMDSGLVIKLREPTHITRTPGARCCVNVTRHGIFLPQVRINP